jgi:hypothetical protein
MPKIIVVDKPKFSKQVNPFLFARIKNNAKIFERYIALK